MGQSVVEITWQNLLMVTLGSGLLSVLVTGAAGGMKDFIKSYFARKRQATYVAIRTAAILEKLSIQCAELISHNKAYLYLPEYDKLKYRLPPVEEYPQDLDWQSLDVKFTARLLSVPNELTMMQRGVESLLDEGISTADPDHDDEISLADMVNNYAGRIGYRSWVLATELRDKHKIAPISEIDRLWKFEELLKAYHDQAIDDQLAYKGH